MTTVVSSLNASLHKIMTEDESVFLIGEDILDPYGGTFKVTKGLSESYPSRVLTTPISEAAIVGIACGMAMRGMKPVVEIMFGDFITLASDQIINHASKFRWLFNDHFTVPMVIRTPMGGYRGYGATHSQCLEKFFMGVPGLRTIAVNSVVNPGKMLENAVLKDRDPVLFLEHKLLYSEHLQKTSDEGRAGDFWVKSDERMYPTCILSLNNFAHADISIACYGYTLTMAQRVAVKILIEHEIFSEIIVFSELSPLNVSLLVHSVEETKNLIVVEEGTCSNGWGAEVIANIFENISAGKEVTVRRIAARDLPIPSSFLLENEILPTDEDIYSAILEVVHQR